MKSIKKFFHNHWFTWCASGVVLLGLLARCYRYFDRWGLAFDQAHDTILAQYALQTHQLPLLGPFSSAGPFQTGGEWYWFIMIGRILFPFLIQGPWLLLTMLQVFFVGLMLYSGYLIGGKRLSLVVGLLAALSPAGISQAINLTNQSLLNLCAAFLIISALLYFKTKQEKYLFSMGIFTSLGATLHLQGVLLVLFSLCALLAGKVTSKKGLFLFLIGAILPVVPLFSIDYLHKWFNTKNMLQYYLHDQYRIPLESLGRRWTTYLDFLWPTLWGNAISGNIWVGYGFMVVGLFFLGKTLIQRKLNLSWILLTLPFLAVLFLLKNVRTPIFDSYIMFLHPFIFLISAGLLLFLVRFNKYLGIFLIFLVLIVALQKDIGDSINAKNWSALRSREWMNVLTHKYPGEKFALYDYKFRSTTESGPLVMYLQYYNLLDNNGHKIGFGLPSTKDSIYAQDYQNLEIKENIYGFNLIDLNSSSSAQLAKESWGPINPSYMYNAQENWYK